MLRIIEGRYYILHIWSAFLVIDSSSVYLLIQHYFVNFIISGGTHCLSLVTFFYNNANALLSQINIMEGDQIVAT